MTHGADAATPAKIPFSGWKDVALRVKNQVAKDRVGLLAAGVAFYGLLALFPAITAVIAIFGLLIAFYSASKGTASLIQGLNVAYSEDESRGFIRWLLVTFALTLMLIAGVICGLTATLAIPTILAFVDMGSAVAMLVNAALWLGLISLTIVGLSVLYRFAPSRDTPEWQWTSVGAVVGCLVWITASASFAFFVSKFSYYNQSFGALAGVVVLLMWFWISAYIIIMGAELNAELEAQTRADTTVGGDKAIGTQDAEKPDHPGVEADT